MNFRDGQDELLLVGFHEEREQRLYVNALRDSDVEKWALVDGVGTKVDSTSAATGQPRQNFVTRAGTNLATWILCTRPIESLAV